MRVAVAGAGGFVGRYLCRRLAAQGIGVVALSSGDGTGLDPASGEFPQGFDLPPGVDAVVYLAQSPHHRPGDIPARHLLAVSVLSAVRMAELARARGIRRFLFASTGSVYRPSFAPLAETDAVRRDNWYLLSKVHAEEALDLFRRDLDITSVRLFGVYGPGQTGRLVPNLIAAVAEGRPITLERNPRDVGDDGGLRLSLCHVEDIAEILQALLGVEGVPVVNLASDEALSIRDIAVAAGRVLDRAPSFVPVERARDSDLIADIGLLKRLVAPRFRRFSEQIAALTAAR